MLSFDQKVSVDHIKNLCLHSRQISFFIILLPVVHQIKVGEQKPVDNRNQRYKGLPIL